MFLATVYLLPQAALATIGAFFYNLVSDLVGGIEVVVLEESYGEETPVKQRRTKKEKDENKETVFMTLSRTVKKMRDERNKEKDETAYPEMPRPDVPRDIEEQTLSESFKNISNEEDEQK